MSNFFEQPVEPVVSQEEEASHTSLQENPANGNHYGSTDWIWGLKDNTVGPLYLKMPIEDLNSSQSQSCNLQALAAAFGVVTELQLQEEKI